MRVLLCCMEYFKLTNVLRVYKASALYRFSYCTIARMMDIYPFTVRYIKSSILSTMRSATVHSRLSNRIRIRSNFFFFVIFLRGFKTLVACLNILCVRRLNVWIGLMFSCIIWMNFFISHYPFFGIWVYWVSLRI